MRQAFLPNDVVNLFIGLPVLWGSIALARRGRLPGLLLWPGALLFVFYNYVVYVFGRPVDWLTLIHLALVILSALALFDLLRSINPEVVQAQLSGAVPVRTAGWISVAFGVAFIFRTLGILFDASANQVKLLPTEVGPLIADVALSIILIVGGALLIRRMPLGYVCGLGLLFAMSMLFVGLVVFLLLRPFLTHVPFDLTEVIVVAAMGLVSFVPFALYLRGAAQKDG